MKEKEIKTEKVEKKKVYRRPKRTDKDIKVIDTNDEINEMFMRSGEVIQNNKKTQTNWLLSSWTRV